MSKETKPVSTEKKESTDQIPLEEAVNLVRAEIEKLVAVKDEHALRFEVEGVEIEFNTVFGKTTGAGGKLKASILGWGAEGNVKADYKSEQVQKIKLKLKPRPPIKIAKSTALESNAADDEVIAISGNIADRVND